MTQVPAVGSDAPEKRELHPALLRDAAVVADVLHQCLEVGESHHALTAGDVGAELGQVVAAAQAVYRAAVAGGGGLPPPLWD